MCLNGEVHEASSANVVAQLLFLEADNPEEGHLAVHQLARRLRHGRPRHLRHHDVRALPRHHHLHRPGRLHGLAAPVRRAPPATASACPTRPS